MTAAHLLPLKENRREPNAPPSRGGARFDVLGVPSAAKRLPRHSRAKFGQSFSIPKARLASIFKEPKTPNLDRLLAEAGKVIRQHSTQSADLRQSVESILSKASGEGWSARKLAEKIGISPRTWSRILNGKADLKVWLPQVRAAAASVNTPQPSPFLNP